MFSYLRGLVAAIAAVALTTITRPDFEFNYKVIAPILLGAGLKWTVDYFRTGNTDFGINYDPEAGPE
jgi:hypothetical protein